MADFLNPLITALSQFGWRDAVDIAVMSFIIYAIMRMVSKTRAVRVVLGLAVILLFAWVAELLDLPTLMWLFEWLVNASAVFIVILFQPELRRALERLGRGKIFTQRRTPAADGQALVRQFMRALEDMARGRVGAILVFERQTGLADIVESGIVIDADVSSELIETIFYPNNPLHDGAMIVRDGRIWAAGCFLPLSDNRQISSMYGSRHRASLGASEVSDAYVLTVSEERGTISFIYDGVLTPNISVDRVRQILNQLYVPEPRPSWAERHGISQEEDLSASTKEINTDQIREADREYKERRHLQKSTQTSSDPEDGSGEAGADSRHDTDREDEKNARRSR